MWFQRVLEEHGEHHHVIQRLVILGDLDGKYYYYLSILIFILYTIIFILYHKLIFTIYYIPYINILSIFMFTIFSIPLYSYIIYLNI